MFLVVIVFHAKDGSGSLVSRREWKREGRSCIAMSVFIISL